MNKAISIFLPKVEVLCQRLSSESQLISQSRREQLNLLSDYISTKVAKAEPVRIIVVCTHNSRRSHLGQLWLAIAAEFYKFAGTLETFSGGTEATALNERVAVALKEAGFDISFEKEKENPVYNITWSTEMTAYQAFSKRYQDPPNPTKGFAAVMVCSEANEACPVVSGCEYRIALPYNDPKAFDDTDQEQEKYTERLIEIGREMMYVMSQVK